MNSFAEALKAYEAGKRDQNLTFRCESCGQPPKAVRVTSDPMSQRVCWEASCCSQQRSGELTGTQRARVSAGAPVEIHVTSSSAPKTS